MYLTSETTRTDDSDRRERLAAGLGGRFFLDVAIAVSDAFDGDILRGLVLIAILQQNLGEIGALDRGPRPATVYGVAKSLGLNYETTRRYAKRLTEQGYCVRTPEGLVVPDAALKRLEIARTVRRVADNVETLSARMSEAGLGAS